MPFPDERSQVAVVDYRPEWPYFAAKAARVLDLYARVWDGEPLGPTDFVLSADEKPGVQARSRIHPITPPGPRQPMRVEHEHGRHGTLAYLAAYDVHRAKVKGRCEHTTGIKPFTALVDQVIGDGGRRLQRQRDDIGQPLAGLDRKRPSAIALRKADAG